MPAKRYIHNCNCDSESPFAESCWNCGEPGAYVGWEGVRFDKMAAYAREHGLKPIGLHRKLADEIFDGVFLTCGRCGGRAYLAGDADNFRPCDACSACGVVFAVPLEEVAALRARVIAVFPDAAHEPPPVEGPFILANATGTMISVTYPDGKSEGEGGRGSL